MYNITSLEDLNKIKYSANTLCSYCENDECEKCIIMELVDNALLEAENIADNIDDVYSQTEMSVTTIAIDQDIKEAADKLFYELGIDFETAVNVFVRKSLLTNGIPFTLTVH